jgi:tRNA threonylcarbamoyl adenosine modification protein YeaZ
LLLSIDTSAGTSAALFDGERLLSSVFFDDPFGHAENIAKAITGALSQADLAANALENIAVGIGPAPYTGLRVGIAAAKALAGPLGVGLQGVMVLDAIAFSRTEERLLVTTDAKRGELFAAGYVFGKREFGPRVIDPSSTAEFGDYEHVSEPADAEKVGRYALWALEKGIDLSETGAIYLRSPDVTPSPGKRVSG